MSRFGVSKSQRAFTAVALLLAVLYMAAGLSVWLGVWNPNEFARSPWGVGGLLAGFLIVLGVWIRRRRLRVDAAAARLDLLHDHAVGAGSRRRGARQETGGSPSGGDNRVLRRGSASRAERRLTTPSRVSAGGI